MADTRQINADRTGKRKNASLMRRFFAGTALAHAEIARRIRVSKTTLSLLLSYGTWPKKDPDGFRRKIEDFLAEYGVPEYDIAAAFDELERGDQPSNTTEVFRMICKQTLSYAAKRHFSIPRDVFSDDINATDDVFLSPEINFVMESLYQTARHGGMVAFYGESGSGKSTVRRALTAKLQKKDPNVLVIRPSDLGANESVKSGGSMRAMHICEAILAVVAPSAKQCSSPEAKFKQMHRALMESGKLNMRHVLVLEEAHSHPVLLFRHLKRFYELEGYDGRRLLSIIIIGQSELKSKLSESNPEVREVVQRMEFLEMRQIDDLAGYIKHRFARAGASAEKVLAPDALDALAERLSGPPAKSGKRKSLLYPLIIGNTLTKAINEAADLKMDRVTGELILSM